MHSKVLFAALGFASVAHSVSPPGHDKRYSDGNVGDKDYYPNLDILENSLGRRDGNGSNNDEAHLKSL